MAWSVESGVPIRAQSMKPTPISSRIGTLPVRMLAIRLMLAGEPPGVASLSGAVLLR